MPTFLPLEDFQTILEEREPGRRAGAAKRLFADFEAGALDDDEARAASSIFRAIVRDEAVTVRHAFARFVHRTRHLSADLAATIADDVSPKVAAPFLRQCPALADPILVDAVGRGEAWRQIAVAGRRRLPSPVAAALAEVGVTPAVAALLAVGDASIPAASLARIAERFADDDTIAELLLGYPGVPGDFVEARIHKVSDRLKSFVDHTGWLRPEATGEAIGNAVEHSLIEFAVGCSRADLAPIFAKWSLDGRITRGFVLRSACYGALPALELALCKIAGLPLARGRALWDDEKGYGRQSLIARTGFGNEEEEFISRSVLRFSDLLPGLFARHEGDWRMAVARGIEDVIENEASSNEFMELIEGFAVDAGFDNLCRERTELDRAA